MKINGTVKQKKTYKDKDSIKKKDYYPEINHVKLDLMNHYYTYQP